MLEWLLFTTYGQVHKIFMSQQKLPFINDEDSTATRIDSHLD